MRQAFCRGLAEFSGSPEFVFLTGDLGFSALEPVRDAMGTRFINAGISEQNMVSVAAGLAKSGMRPWVYSIAPFLYARAFEQIRNDVCLHNLSVVITGNGGGYGYGVMGSTHHALEDYGTLLTLPNMRAFVPAFDGDIATAIAILMRRHGPSYLRLGLSEQPAWLRPAAFAPWRRIMYGQDIVVVLLGALAGGIIAAIRDSGIAADVWLVSELPADLPPEFLDSVRAARLLLVVEEHTFNGSFGQTLSHQLLSAAVVPRRFLHRAALGYVSGRYGSQKFHRRECGLDAASIIADMTGAVSR